MADRTAKIFIASSKEDQEFTAQLTVALKEKGYKLNSWPDRFPSSVSILEAFGQQLDHNDFFVILFSHNASSVRAGKESAMPVANENVVFETGAAYGRYGMRRTILFRDPSVKLPSDLDGVVSIKVNFKDEDVNTNVIRVVNEIDRHISKIEIEQYDSRLRWLSLIKCKPAYQQDVVGYIEGAESKYNREWGAILERYGVIWGPPDNFLLFSVPSVEHFIGFITALRNTFKGVVTQVDSRLIFPNRYWQQAKPPSEKMKHHQLVLLSCAPEHVEDVYHALTDAGKDEAKRGIEGVDIVTVGIMTGDADVFFITASDTYESHRVFIEKHLHKSIMRVGWLIENTTSMPMT